MTNLSGEPLVAVLVLAQHLATVQVTVLPQDDTIRHPDFGIEQSFHIEPGSSKLSFKQEYLG